MLKIEGEISIPLKNADFSRTVFYKSIVLNNFHVIESLKFIEANFQGGIYLNNISFPQLTDFKNAKFAKLALQENNESSFRVIRGQFKEHNNSYMEGIFYAYEQRCHRKKNWYGVSRGISALYDWTSIYGLSYERVISVFLFVQIMFWGIYKKLLPSDFHIHGEVVSPVYFTLSQILKPFNLFEPKTIEVLQGSENINIIALSYYAAFHSIASYLLIAVGLLAVRWRFRRN